MNRNGSSATRTQGNESRVSTDDVWNWAGDDLISERVTEAVRRWLEGMESAIETATSDRET